MKRKYVLIILSIIFSTLTGITQKSTVNYDIYLDFGLKYTPIEYLGGPILGISLDNPQNKIAFNLRNDIIFAVGVLKNDPVSPYQITDYHTYNYLDIDYKFSPKIRLSAGMGWIYEGKKENYKLNEESGYPSITLAFKYKVSWLTMEIRGDIPFEKYNKVIDQGHLFPISFGFTYKFLPKKEINKRHYID